jgi:hypothetical protein
MTLESESERAELERLIQRTAKCLRLVQDIQAVDPNESICAQETNSLATLAAALRIMVDRGQMRNCTFFRLVDLILDLQEAAVSDRKAELGI